MNNFRRRTLPLRADKNFGYSHVLRTIPGESCAQHGTTAVTDQ
jgi:hypothetical protein